jgi:hypothetical protein
VGVLFQAMGEGIGAREAGCAVVGASLVHPQTHPQCSHAAPTMHPHRDSWQPAHLLCARRLQASGRGVAAGTSAAAAAAAAQAASAEGEEGAERVRKSGATAEHVTGYRCSPLLTTPLPPCLPHHLPPPPPPPPRQPLGALSETS